MTPEPEQLKALAEAAHGWNLNFVMNMTDEEPCEVGWKDEDGCFYPLITVDCENYFQPSGPLADYIAAALILIALGAYLLFGDILVGFL